MEVANWLEGLKLGVYIPIFASHGIDTMEQSAHLTSDDLTSMGITLQGHRNRILKHIPSVAQTSSAVGKETASLPMALNELDDILGNIEAMLGELDVDDADEQQTDRRMSVQQQQAEQLGIFKELPDSELDSLLNDLCSFGTEGDKVIERKPRTAPLLTLVPELPERPSQNPSVSSPAVEQPNSSAESNVQRPRPILRKQISAPPDPRNIAEHLDAFRKRLSTTGQISQNDLDAMMKEEKIRIAMEKMAAASNQQSVIKVNVSDGTTKTLCIDAKDTAFEVCRKLVVKNRFDDSPFWQLIEICPSLGIQVFYEDHELVSLHFNAWPPFCDYEFNLRVNDDKYGIFLTPEKYFPRSVREDIEQTAATSKLAGSAKQKLFQEYFSNTSRLPDVKGFAHIKESKKWKKRFCVLRASGVYFSLKGESEASADLQVYVKFDEYTMYHALPFFINKTKAPSEFCLVFRPKLRKRVFEIADLAAISFTNLSDLNIWCAGIRFAVHGSKLRDGFEDTTKRFEKLAEMGEFNMSKLESFKRSKRKDVLQTNRHLVRQWQAMRAGSGQGNVSAATGVEFDDMAEDIEKRDDKQLENTGLLVFKWFHGALSRNNAEHLLSQYNYAQGCFLVRESSTHVGDYVISLCYDGKPHHYHMKRGSDGGLAFGLDQGPRFPTVDQLIDHYSTSLGRLPTRLVLEVPRQ